MEQMADRNKTASEVKQAEKEAFAKTPENTFLQDVLNEMLKLTKEHNLDRP